VQQTEKAEIVIAKITPPVMPEINEKIDWSLLEKT